MDEINIILKYVILFINGIYLLMINIFFPHLWGECTLLQSLLS